MRVPTKRTLHSEALGPQSTGYLALS